ncbi:tryptophan-rich sensory protein [Spirosoma rhododendri]|uniref:Tryptophan-rich sensory protein n=1 Tax=Spirosoma rhododendri TaxID=2728024 RepID=A0A7L5DNZ8_9BACT|nr:tryptophan-rich sensory protein [Spirosoma rhododendri]QJD78208.1 tryptophan-rich sensory protein [Spirosoma rhododendri]
MSDKLRQFLVVFTIVSLIVMNALSNTGAFGGQTNGTVSAKYPTLITPAGYAFSIWGLIFLGLLIFAIYQALPAQATNRRFRAAGPWIILNAICNAIWSPIFNQEWIGMALLIILVMFFSLLMTVEKLEISSRLDIPDPASTRETWLARIPFLLYFGWLTVATILNVAVYLKASNFPLSGLSESTWAEVILVVGLVVGTYLFNRYRSVAYILVFAWAYAAIAVKQQANAGVLVVAGVGAVVAVGLAIAGLVSRRTPNVA